MDTEKEWLHRAQDGGNNDRTTIMGWGVGYVQKGLEIFAFTQMHSIISSF